MKGFDPHNVYFDTPTRLTLTEDPMRPNIIRATMDINSRELLARHHLDMIRDVVGRLGHQIAAKICDELMNGNNMWEQLIKDAIKAEIQLQVKDEISKRVDSIIEDVVDNL